MMFEMFIVLAQAVSFYVIPWSVGSGVMVLKNVLHKSLFRKKLEQKPHTLTSLPLQFVWYFGLGTLILFAEALVSRYLISSLSSLPFTQVFFPLAYGSFIAGSLLSMTKFRQLKILRNPKAWITLLGIGCVAALGYWIIGLKTPYSLNWDLYEHQVLVKTIQDGKYSFFTTQMSDSFGFNAYPPVFHTIVALSQRWSTWLGFGETPVRILSYWQTIGFLHMFLVTLASYVFGLVVTKNKWIALLSCLFGGLVFESVLAFTNFFFLPQTHTAMMFALLFGQILYQGNQKRPVGLIKAAISVLFLCLSHYVVGVFAALLYVSTWVYYRFQRPLDRFLKAIPLVELGILLALIGMGVSPQLNLSGINKGEAGSYIFSTAEKFEYMRRVYGFSLFVLLPLGIIESMRRKQKEVQLTVLYTLGFVAILVSQFPYVLKFFVLARFFLHVVMALGVWTFLRRIHFRLIRGVGVLVVFLALILILIFNVSTWKQWLNNRGNLTHISNDDILAAEYLQKNYGNTKAMLIGDPTTQYILEGLSGVNSPGGFAMEDRLLFDQVAATSSASEKVKILSQVKDTVESQPGKRIYVMSGRTRLWHQAGQKEKASFEFSIWTPQNLTLVDELEIQNLVESGQVQLVYRNPSIVVLELKN